MIDFYLNGQRHQISSTTPFNPNTTILDYLRLHQRITDSKEGCGSGDCGACTVMVQSLLPVCESPAANKQNSSQPQPFYTVNACITLLSLMDGQHIMTASYLADNPNNHPKLAKLHPAQQAMVECHGSQCGFCTPGFVMSLACAYENNAHNEHDNQQSQLNVLNSLSYDEVVASISGNLCRCTGYRPIIEAGLRMQQMATQTSSQSSKAQPSKAQSSKAQSSKAQSTKAMTALAKKCKRIAVTEVTQPKSDVSLQSTSSELSALPILSDGQHQLFIPTSLKQLQQLLATYPTATLWAGGTDLGLSITQHLLDHKVIIQLSAVTELQTWQVQSITSVKNLQQTYQDKDNAPKELVLGAGMTYQQMLPVLQQYFEPFAQLFSRIASPQIRNMGTIGGNIANASPIGDLPPVLLALNARIHLRHLPQPMADAGFEDDILPLSEFFIDYKKTKLRAGSFIVAIHIPLLTANQHLFIHKISKRYEDDISACLFAACIELSADQKVIESAKIGLGGMAAVPLLAQRCQQALIGQPVTLASFEQASCQLSDDVSPLTDVRASREYRLHVAKRLLLKCGKQLLAKLS